MKESNVLQLIFNDKQYIINFIKEPTTVRGVALLVNEENNFMPICFGEFSKFELMGVLQALSNATFLDTL